MPSKIVPSLGEITMLATAEELPEVKYKYLSAIPFAKSSVTSLTVETYKTYISPDSLLKLVIDFDPFLEYYECKDSKIDWFHNENGIDTTKLNEVINNNELNKYFNRLK